jgi:hypothetical protein
MIPRAVRILSPGRPQPPPTGRVGASQIEKDRREDRQEGGEPPDGGGKRP